MNKGFRKILFWCGFCVIMIFVIRMYEGNYLFFVGGLIAFCLSAIILDEELEKQKEKEKERIKEEEIRRAQERDPSLWK